MATLKMATLKAIMLAAVTFFTLAVTLVYADVNPTEITANLTGSGNTESSEEGMSTELKVCLVIAFILTVLGIIACLVIKKKGESNYATGDNLPKALGGMQDDF